MLDIFKKIEELQKTGHELALCTIVSAKGSVPLGVGAKMIVLGNGEIYGTVGGGYVEKLAIENAEKLIKSNSSKLLKIVLNKESGTCCGGKVEIFIEAMNKKKKLYIFGGGHVCRALLTVLHSLEFDVIVIDDRADIFDDEVFKSVKTLVSDFDEYLNKMEFGRDIFIAIITYEHSADYRILSHCLKNQWHYLGMMGSLNKIKTMSGRLISEGIDKEIIEKVDMPIGKNIEAETSHEIAVSIASELIESRAKLRAKLKKNLKSIENKGK
jgi:xanthine dehydrogenase accessory factor